MESLAPVLVDEMEPQLLTDRQHLRLSAHVPAATRAGAGGLR